MRRFFCIICFVFSTTVAVSQSFNSRDYIKALKDASDLMINDVTSPVAAARYYAYITLAGNGTLSVFDQKYSIDQGLRLFNPLQATDLKPKDANRDLAVLYAVYKMSTRLFPSGSTLSPKIDSLTKLAAAKGIPDAVIHQSMQIADAVILNLLKYVQADHFREMSSLRKYTPLQGDAYWQPTSPGYMAALEPNWNSLRLFVLPSVDSFRCPPPAAFDTSAQSSFYRQLKEVYTTVNHLSTKQAAIASFWDCNPFALQQMGHIEFGLKKMSPGGHWMGITGIACLNSSKSFEQTSLIHTLVALSMSDAFVCCWNEKYLTNRVRPETAIRKWIDPAWKPLLQTPPFPEYTSGHSVVSSASAVMLTAIFGDNFRYTDNSEMEFGLKPRKFKSFEQAASEAAISRLYGGIHYRDAIENGVAQGKAIGAYYTSKMISYISLVK